jgi:ATP-dependent helicase/nuclease subunit A
MPRLEVPLETRVRQAEASDPGRSAWVAANAGSGKTTVLSRRVIRLLLDGAPPSRILCLTFTKAAAAEMSNRVFETLSKWTRLDDTALRSELAEFAGGEHRPVSVGRARTLFARALEAPGGLKIQTIHAFCEALLHQFPLEANMTGHFEVMDGQREAEMLAEARSVVLAAARSPQGGHSRLANAWSTLLDIVSDTQLEEALAELVVGRTRLLEFAGQDLDAAIAPAWSHFGHSRSSDETTLIAGYLARSPLSDARWREIMQAARTSTGKSDSGFADKVEAFLAAGDPRTRFNLRNACLLTEKQEPRANPVTNAVEAQIQGVKDELRQEAARAVEDLADLQAFRMLCATHALFEFGGAVIGEYDALKRRRGLSDFSDLIERSANLLAREDARDWVRYKLDRGIDHLLVDEAQDTSPRQWEIINALIEEFSVGEGASRPGRTVFVVGDEKQSIYSFQGADPGEYAHQRRALRQRIEQGGGKYEEVSLNLSFRSVPDILHAVDRVFEDADNRRGLQADGMAEAHAVARQRDRGDVRIWPLIAGSSQPQPEEWNEPVDAAAPDDPAILLAKRVAETLQQWIGRETLPGMKKPLAAGDVMILVRRRDCFATAVIREMNRLEIATAGSDRLRLTEHVAIEDLMALGRFVAMPEDDLALAGALKSPLFDVAEDDLTQIASQRGAISLWARIGEIGDDAGHPLRQMCETLRVRLEDLLSPGQSAHSFYAHVLGRFGGRRAFLARFGAEAQEVLDAFEQLALDHERDGDGSLQSLLAALRDAPPEIKREADSRRDEVRVITVHAAKGLEAPVVFLVDPCTEAFQSAHRPQIIDAPGLGLLWRIAKSDRLPPLDQAIEELKTRAEEEYRRLLYVAMTRARDRLVICGFHGVRTPKNPHWHEMVLRQLQPDAETVAGENGEVAEWIWRSAKIAPRTESAASAPEAWDAATQPSSRAAPQEIQSGQPEWLRRDAAREKLPARPLRPSTVFEAAAMAASPAGPDARGAAFPPGDGFALKWGTIVHFLLQEMPSIDADRRSETARAWLERRCPHWREDQRAEALRQAQGVLDMDALAPLFGPGSRAEVDVAGHVDLPAGRALVTGKIDRLAITADSVSIADFKTGRRGEAEIPRAYLLQLALYSRLLSGIYPGRDVRAFLVWTLDGQVQEAGRAQMSAALAALGRSDGSRESLQ